MRAWSFVLLLGHMAGAQAALTRHEYTEVHMGMPVRIVLYADTDSAARSAGRAAFRRVAALDNTLSEYRPQSEVRRLVARAGEWLEVSPELFEVVTLSVEVARATGGAFDPTVAPLSALWREARRTRTMPAAARLDSARAMVGFTRISVDSARQAIRLQLGTSLDFGGIAKGYIIGQARRVLEEHGIHSLLIEAGGDIVVGAAPPGEGGWRVDVGDASGKMRPHLAEISNAAIATSGPTAQFVEIGGKRYSHVVDPRTGLGLTNGRTVRVIASDPAIADAVATAVSVLGRPVAFRGVKSIDVR